MKANILGTDYAIIMDENLIDKDGLCDKSVKKIKVCKTLYRESEKGEIENLKWQADKVLRHEIVHALLFESGLSECHERIHNEQVVDWVASMYPKMKKIFEQLQIEE